MAKILLGRKKKNSDNIPERAVFNTLFKSTVYLNPSLTVAN